VKPPFDVGFEAIGVIEAKGDQVQKYKVGDPVVFTKYGAFAEYIAVDENSCFAIPSLSPKFLPLMASGLTASISLEQVGQMKSGETVLVTAAAGATGLFAVQLAKLAGNHVIGTVSSDNKSKILKELGCDRVINYRTENLTEVLKKEYPKGIDLVYESVGGEMFDICVQNLAVHGRLIVIGAISGYKDGSAWKEDSQKNKYVTPLPQRLLAKSSSVRGFFLNSFPTLWESHFKNLCDSVTHNKLQSCVDTQSQFIGLESIPDAIDYLFQQKNIGKVFVELPRSKL